MEDLKGRHILILGMGLRTTPPLVKVLKGLGAEISINDCKEREELKPQLEALKGLTYHLHTGDHRICLENIHTIIVNPAVPLENPLLKEAEKLRIPFYGELELAYQLLKAPIIAITGTNGKTSTTYLLGEILKRGDRRVEVGGNIGRALIGLVGTLKEEDLVVAEVSSFQLTTIKDFSPELGAILNISPDHLDYHHSYKEYREAKKRIFVNQGPGDYVLLNRDEPLFLSWERELKGEKYFFSRSKEVSRGAYLKGDKIFLKLSKEKEEEILSLDQLSSWGRLNSENILAAIVIAGLYGIKKEAMVEVISSFKGLEHRQEEVATIQGVTYFNNSKATNPQATLRDLDLFQPPLILIMGGQSRGIHLHPLYTPIIEKVSLVILLGETAEELEEGLRRRGYHTLIRVKDLEEAVRMATLRAKAGTKVLLSPASPSWDMFTSYEERGREFKELVNRLKGKGKGES